MSINSWADTCCSGRHAFVKEFVEGKMVNVVGFADSLGTVENLLIAHVVYAYNLSGSSVILLECNNSIYMENTMKDVLINPIQCKEHNAKVDIRSQLYLLSPI